MRARVPNFAKSGKPKFTNNEKRTGFFSKKEIKIKDIEKERDFKDREALPPKQRPSFAQLPHPASFSTLYQLHQMQSGVLGTVSKRGNFQRQNSQPEPYSIWHSKSFESGIGKDVLKIQNLPPNLNSSILDAQPPYPIYGRLPTPARGYVPIIPKTKIFVGDWE